MTSEDDWYATRRAKWKPDHVRLLLIAESAPDDGGDIKNRRFFYDDNLTAHDGLFREVVKTMFNVGALPGGPRAKTPWLRKLQERGVYLIDLAPVPVNYMAAERDAVLAANVAECVALARSLEPGGVVVLKKNVFEMLQDPLRQAGLPLLHDRFIPFPGSGQQKRFREAFAAALATAPRQ